MSKTKQTATFNKATLLSAVASVALLAPERLHLPELDGDVFVKRMSVGEREDYFKKMKPIREAGNLGNVEAFMYAVVDENGKLLFDETNDEDITAVRSLPNTIIERVIETFSNINFKLDTPKTKADDLKNS